ncbi:MAG: M61 family metallopeptidase [Alphaproteobacteria bacterium]|nr:M61 family metallopeptidase [Alphaproteobacteria bacterium]
MWIVFAALAAPPQYTVSFPDHQAHMVQVEAVLPASGGQAELFMATWTPGSYLIREFARNVEGLEALGPDGALPVEKTSKNRWVVQTGDLDAFTLRYRVYCRTMNVRECFVDSDFAVLNGAPTFIVPADLQGPYAITVERPAGWEVTMTQLSPDDADAFTAPTYDLLVDSPIVVGNPTRNAFTVDGVEHVLVDFPAVEPWNSAKAATAVERVAKELHRFWGQLPYDRYLYLNLLGEAGGGLEHLGSTLLITSRFGTREDDAFERWLGLVAHEHFHAWNVKRFRPAALGPFDYENEVYTESLWVAEGFTSYYDDVLLARAGLIDRDEYLTRMGTNLSTLESTPGRLEQPIARASHDAWIKYYRGDENTVNTAISYYTKGAVVAWVIDARIRKLTNGARSLDDAMRLAYTRFSGDAGYTPEQFVAVLSEVAGADLAPFVHTLAETTEEVDLSEALEVFGLVREPEASDGPPAPWLGVSVDGSNRVYQVLRNTPAWEAGINVDDEVLAVGDDRVTDLSAALKPYGAGAKVAILVARRGRLRRIDVTLGEKPGTSKLKIDPKAKKKAEKTREAWIGVHD